ncbi:hypothetical protein [Aeromonas dhakensis]|uniref:hypothetical protein n=1 Tax=Aeromonas dhakensis TaxID=196024 RepID=UPI001A8D12F2
MNTIKVAGIDIAKSVFQVCVWMADGSVAWNRKISRQKVAYLLLLITPGVGSLIDAAVVP